MLKLSDDIRRQVQQAVQYPFSDKRTDKSLLIQLFEEIFFVQLCKTCENEQIFAYIKLFRLINPKEQMQTPSKKYRLNPKNEGQTVSIPRYRWEITSATLTDEQANYLLSNDAYKGLVVTVSEADEISKEMESEVVEELEKMTKAELKSLLDAKGVTFESGAKKSELLELAKSA